MLALLTFIFENCLSLINYYIGWFYRDWLKKEKYVVQASIEIGGDSRIGNENQPNSLVPLGYSIHL